MILLTFLLLGQGIEKPLIIQDGNNVIPYPYYMPFSGSRGFQEKAVKRGVKGTGVITGKVTDEGGNPLSGILVYAGGDSGWYNSTTNSNGNYLIDSLPTGGYYIHIVDERYIYLEEWYNNAFNIYGANIVSVVEPETTKGIDVVLEKGGFIEGTVLTDSGTPCQNCDVVFKKYLSRPTYLYTLYTRTDTLGHFIKGAIYSGIYSFKDTFTVIAPDTIQYDITLPKKGIIKGTIKDTSDSLIKGYNIYLYAYNALSSGLEGMTWANDGIYSLSLPKGLYKIKVLGYNEGYISEFYNNKLYIKDADTIRVIANDTTILDFVLEKGGKIKGHTYESDGITPIKIYPYLRYSNNGQGVSLTKSDSTGAYTLQGLPADTFKLFGGWMWHNYPRTNLAFEWYNDKNNWGDADKIYLPSTQDSLTGIDFILDEGGYITGKVEDENGNPIKGANVYVWDYTGPNSGWRNWYTPYDVYTDTLGNYIISGLRTGDYMVLGMAPGYKYQWYYLQDDSSTANLVSVINGDTVKDINFVLSKYVSGIKEKRHLSSFIVRATNPAYKKIRVEYHLSHPEEVKIKVFDVLGRNVYQKQVKGYAGKNIWQWQGNLSSGIYFCLIKAGKQKRSIKVVFIK